MLVADDCGIVGDLDRLEVSLVIAGVGGVFQGATGKTGHNVEYARLVLVIGFHAPETAAGEQRSGRFCGDGCAEAEEREEQQCKTRHYGVSLVKLTKAVDII